jgi:hypothetical protein
LFVAAGLAEPKASSSQSTTKYKNGVKTRKDFSVPYTRHDMRRAFNVAAKQAGMSIDDRCTILGHGVTVNKEHYNGKPELDVERVSEFLEKMKLEGVG